MSTIRLKSVIPVGCCEENIAPATFSPPFTPPSHDPSVQCWHAQSTQSTQ